MKFVQILVKGLLRILLLILAVVLFIGVLFLLSLIQGKVFLPREYILWTFNYPVSRLIFIFELYLVVFLVFKGCLLAFLSFAKRNKKWFYPTFALANLVLIYALLFNVSVITKNSIVDHTFLIPQGKVYRYSDIASIDTGVYGRKLSLPFTHSTGEFYYTLTLKDGVTVNLNDSVGGTKNDQDVYEVFEELDDTFVNMGIKKTASMDNLELLEKHLDKKYSDRIKNVLTNKN